MNAIESIPSKQVYFFDVFLGESDSDGRIKKIRSVGRAIHGDGQKVYKLQLKTFLNFDFYLMKEITRPGIDYSLFTREENHLGNGKKYFWHMVGEGRLQSGSNTGILALNWDVFPSGHIYMNLHPKDVRESANLAD